LFSPKFQSMIVVMSQSISTCDVAAVSESQDGLDCAGKRFAGLNRVHDNVGIISGVALCIAVVIVITCIIRYRLASSATISHEDPTQCARNVAGHRRVNLNLDGAPITSKSHTHPSHSKTSRLLTSFLSLGVPVPRPTQCV
jgi:hypothetical protein